jgi:hypothetical protein
MPGPDPEGIPCLGIVNSIGRAGIEPALKVCNRPVLGDGTTRDWHRVPSENDAQPSVTLWEHQDPQIRWKLARRDFRQTRRDFRQTVNERIDQEVWFRRLQEGTAKPVARLEARACVSQTSERIGDAFVSALKRTRLVSVFGVEHIIQGT